VKKPSPKSSAPWNILALDKRPVIVAVVGPNGAGKSTFYEAHLKPAGLRFLNADVMAGEIGN
jgi:predicted ABC-type ATPase